MPSRQTNQGAPFFSLYINIVRRTDGFFLQVSSTIEKSGGGERERQLLGCNNNNGERSHWSAFFSRHHRSVRHLFLYNIQLLLHSTEVTTKGVRANPKERRKQNNLTIMEQAYMGTGSTMEKVCSVVVSFL